MWAEFVANQNTAKINVALSATLSGISIPVPGANVDGCEYIKCPLVKGTKYSLNYTVPVPKLLPSIPAAEVSAKFTGDAGLLGCLSVKGSVVD